MLNFPHYLYPVIWVFLITFGIWVFLITFGWYLFFWVRTVIALSANPGIRRVSDRSKFRGLSHAWDYYHRPRSWRKKTYIIGVVMGTIFAVIFYAFVNLPFLFWFDFDYWSILWLIVGVLGGILSTVPIGYLLIRLAPEKRR